MFFLITRVCKCNKFLWNLSHQLTRKSRAHGDKLKLFMTWKKTFYWQFLMQRILTNKVNKKEHFPWRHSCSCSLETLPLDNNIKNCWNSGNLKLNFANFEIIKIESPVDDRSAMYTNIFIIKRREKREMTEREGKQLVGFLDQSQTLLTNCNI